MPYIFPMEVNGEQVSMRQQVLKGGIYLLVRRGVSVVLGLLGLLLINRIVGPGAQGLFSAAHGIFSCLLAIGVMGTNVYLIRERQETTRELFHLAFWWLLLSGAGLTLATIGGVWLLGQYWVRTDLFTEVSVLLCLGIPLALISYVPAAMLERELDYRRVSLIEISSQLSYYLVAIPLAVAGYGVWALVAGFWSSQLLQFVGFFAAARYRPCWYWSWKRLRPMLAYSFSQAVSGWIYNLRYLMPAVLLLPLAGKEAVGYLTIATRFLSMLGFAQEAAGRLSIPAFARVQDDLQRLTRAVSEAMQLQTLTLGVFLASFTLFAPFVLPPLLGAKWDTQIIVITFILLGARMQLSALFAIQGNALYVRKQNLLMIYANVAYILLFVVLASAAVFLLPIEYKLYGYVVADFIAHLPTYWIKHWGMVRHIGRPDYRVTVIWTTAMLGLLLAPALSGWLYLPAILMLLLPSSRQQMVKLYRELMGKTPPTDYADVPRSTDEPR